MPRNTRPGEPENQTDRSMLSLQVGLQPNKLFISFIHYKTTRTSNIGIFRMYVKTISNEQDLVFQRNYHPQSNRTYISNQT